MSRDNSCGAKSLAICFCSCFSLSLSLSFCLVCKCMLAQFLSLAPFMPGCPEELQADFVLYTGDFSRHHMEQLGGVVRASRQMCL